MTAQAEHHRWGWLVEFDGPDSLITAVDTLRRSKESTESIDSGPSIVAIDAFSPFPIEGLPESLRFVPTAMPQIIFAGGVIGGLSIYALEYWINLYAYPLNIGGRPLHSWPSFLPPTFECVVLGASVFAIGGLMRLCGLPRLHHPVFEVEAFRRASTDGFFLALQSDDQHVDTAEVAEHMKLLGAVKTWEVPDV